MEQFLPGPKTPAWRDLVSHRARLHGSRLRALWADNSSRFEQLCFESDGMLLDLSRQLVDEKVMASLMALARDVSLEDWIIALYAGEPINASEGRPALHCALRLEPDDYPHRSEVAAAALASAAEGREQMRSLSRSVLSGELRGYSGHPIQEVVNIGIGGSDLGLVLGSEALAEYRQPGMRLSCVSNVDGVRLQHVLESIDPARTLFVVASKSFTTSETLVNAQAARDWLVALGGASALNQFVAISTNARAMDEFGIPAAHRLPLWDWVGGRYSIWSTVGFALSLELGWENFLAFLSGAASMDRHFATAPIPENLPALLGLVGVWNRNFLRLPTHAVLPYDDHLRRLPAYLQQLEMESNGKSVTRAGETVKYGTCPVVWGEPGSNGQHSFFQLLHQGERLASADFILPTRSGIGRQSQQDLAIANCLAQIEALAVGRSLENVRETEPDLPLELAAQKVHDGDRPTSLIAFDKVGPYRLGQLLALYEHKVFVQSVVWGLNPFDQWGVELGKQLARSAARAWSGGGGLGSGSVMQATLERLRRLGTSD